MRALIVSMLVAGLGGNAIAGHIEPQSAKKVRLALVNSFFPCDTPNTATQASGTGACTPATPYNSCALSATGSGKLTIVATGDSASGTQALKVIVSARGLNGLCENLEMCVFLSYRATNDDCPEGSCTTFDIQQFEFGTLDTCCTVNNGVCKINATVDASTLQLANDKGTGLELHGCGLVPSFGVPTAAVTCGLLLR